MNDHSEAPTTIKEVGIHIGYMNKNLEAINKKLDSMSETYATKEDHDELKVRVVALESKNTLKNTILWVGLVASAIINIVVIYQLFVGKS